MSKKIFKNLHQKSTAAIIMAFSFLLSHNSYAEVKGLEILAYFAAGVLIVFGILPIIGSIIIMKVNWKKKGYALLYVSILWLVNIGFIYSIIMYFTPPYSSFSESTFLFAIIPITIVELIALILYIKEPTKNRV